MLASRVELQAGQTRKNHPAFTHATALFNNSTENSGDLIKEYEEFRQLSIDPEIVYNGALTVEQALQIWSYVRTSYSKAERNYSLSGGHNQHDFYNYCMNYKYPTLLLLLA